MHEARFEPAQCRANFLGAIGVLSILLTINGVIIKGVFGAAEEVMQKAVSTVQTLGTLVLAAGTALAGKLDTLDSSRGQSS